MNDLRNLGVWLAIVLVLVTGYGFRDELQHVGHRLTLGLIPGSAVTRLADDGTVEVAVGRDNSGHFLVTADVNGTPVRFLVDTGATTIALGHADAARIGIDVANLRYDIPISTANGMARAARVRLNSVELGGITRTGLEATVSEPGALFGSLLGMNFVGTLASFEIRGERLVLRD